MKSELCDLVRNATLFVFDFDGVFTDNGVYLTEEGIELVRCNRSDGLGVAEMRRAGMDMLVLSTEVNPVVAKRCEKLGLLVEHALTDKAARLSEILVERKIDPTRVVYVGNDVNDAGCLELVGIPIVVADAHESVKSLACFVLVHGGGNGAVRELCDAVLQVARQTSPR